MIDNQRLQLAEQVQALRIRVANQLPTTTWRDLMGAAHDRAFVVAGVTRADMLKAFAQAVDDAITKGLGIEWFRKKFDEQIAKTGWDYKGPRNWRTRVIFQTNLRTSYAAARWTQLNDPDLVKLKPFLMYRHSGNAADPRPTHQAMDKLVFHRNDPAVARISPPKGFGCGCYWVAVSARDVARMGGRFGKVPEDYEVPEGWDYVPGASVQSELQGLVDSKASTLPSELERALKDDVTPSTWGLDEWINAGNATLDAIDGDPHAGVMARIDRFVGTMQSLAGSKPARDVLNAAAQRLPRSWVQAAERLGTLHVRLGRQRGFAWTASQSAVAKLPHFGVRAYKAGEGVINLSKGPRQLDTAIHELVHRIQSALPGLDAWFQRLHQRRTAGEPLSQITGQPRGEVGRRDNYLHPYFGREYKVGGALEVMSMTIERILSGPEAMRELLTHDRELVALAVGLLLRWR